MQDEYDDIDRIGAGADALSARTEANFRAFRAHWEACRAGSDVPRRAAIDPREIEPLISNAFIVERIAPGVVRLRVAGMHLNELMGMEARGMPLTSFIAPDDREAFSRHLVDLFDAPAILRMTLRSGRALGRPALAATLMLLPLRSDLGDISRALGCLVSHGSIGRPARRFTISHAETRPVSQTGAEPQATPGLPRSGASLTAIPGRGTRPSEGPRDRGHLRVVT